MTDPATCRNMTELRAGIDALDIELMKLLARRVSFIDRAIELKPAEGIKARAEDRVLAVLANARRNATQQGFDPDLAESLWREMIEWSIAREEVVLGK
ncbi:chorismate mutase [Pontivivens insulae]|uniref:chorismate mutase n=1 Tax=Pontivivens insulae TaxID=1639689 RepID=A0A2R8A8N6_9RHOB|nr:chorismate mutase [Pontivivens insulae]RED18694.1 isochorismate pyruvate lyase [Pontivivens insulae]SPF28592.1 Isochorismate pyruvate lyase [Pontivivens insulae]